MRRNSPHNIARQVRVSVVTELYQDAFVGSSIENGTTIIQFVLRKHNFQQELGTRATLCWCKESYHVDVHELHTPSRVSRPPSI